MSAPLRVFANQAGTSWPKPAPVHDAIARAMKTEPIEAWGTIFPSGRAAIARLLGIPPEAHHRILLTPGCTSAIATMLTDLPWRPGDVVITSSLEHHAMVRVSCHNLCWQRAEETRCLLTGTQTA